MAEQIHYRPEETRHVSGDTEGELARLQGRIAEINGLLDELYASGMIRWLKDFVGAMPQISSIAVEGMNTEQGRAGMRNLLAVAKQLGRVDPDRLEAALNSANAGIDRARETAAGNHDSAYNPPGVTGVFKLLHDRELWSTLAPALEGVKAFSAAREAQRVEADGASGSVEKNKSSPQMNANKRK